jgi:hypothetical protein
MPNADNPRNERQASPLLAFSRLSIEMPVLLQVKANIDNGPLKI